MMRPCVDCGTPAPTKSNPVSGGGVIEDWFRWLHGVGDHDLLMICPDCVNRIVNDDREAWVTGTATTSL